MKAAWAKKGWKEGDGYPDIVVMKWTGDEGGREQYTRRFIADGDTSIGTGSVSRAKQQAGATDGQNAGQAGAEQARSGDGNGTTGDVRNDNRGSSASQLADIGREILNATDAQLKNLTGLQGSSLTIGEKVFWPIVKRPAKRLFWLGRI